MTATTTAPASTLTPALQREPAGLLPALHTPWAQQAQERHEIRAELAARGLL